MDAFSYLVCLAEQLVMIIILPLSWRHSFKMTLYTFWFCKKLLQWSFVNFQIVLHFLVQKSDSVKKKLKVTGYIWTSWQHPKAFFYICRHFTFSLNHLCICLVTSLENCPGGGQCTNFIVEYGVSANGLKEVILYFLTDISVSGWNFSVVFKMFLDCHPSWLLATDLIIQLMILCEQLKLCKCCLDSFMLF